MSIMDKIMSLLKGSAPYSNPAPLNASVKTSYVTIKQKANGVLPCLFLNGYTSPSGSYMNYGVFDVHGINPSTNRKNRISCNAKTEDLAIESAKAKGFAEPFEVHAMPFREPTDNQLAYARDLGIPLPVGLCLEDVSALISRVVDNDESSPLESLGLYADSMGVFFSKFAGERELISSISYQLKGEDKIAFLAYKWTSELLNNRLEDMRLSPNLSLFYEFASFVKDDDAFARSLDNIMNGPSSDLGRTKAYRTFKEFFTGKGLVFK